MFICLSHGMQQIGFLLSLHSIEWKKGLDGFVGVGYKACWSSNIT